MKYTKGHKYRVEENFHIATHIMGYDIHTGFLDLDVTGKLTIKKGYAWDGSSGPAIDTTNSMLASCVHDALYQLMREKLLRQEYRRTADLLYHDLLEDDGMWWPRRKLQHWAVARFAKSAASPKNKRIVYEV